METRANYVLVGLFTLLSILAAFGFVLWTAGIGDRGETASLRIRIPGSASGLGRGSAILFNGVRVGDIRRVYLDVMNPEVAVADATVDRLTPITRSTRADVGIAGLTGQANIELRGADPSEPNLLDLAEAEGRVAEIVANPSAVANLLQSAQSIFERANNVLGELESFASETRGPLTQTVRNVEEFSEAMGRNAEGIDDFLAAVSSASDTLSSVSERVDSTLAAAEDLIRAVDREQVSQVVDNVQSFTQRLDEASVRVDGILARLDTVLGSGEAEGLMGEASETLAAFRQVADTLNARMGAITDGLARFSGQGLREVETLARDGRRSIERIERAITDLERNPQRVLSGGAGEVRSYDGRARR